MDGGREHRREDVRFEVLGLLGPIFCTLLTIFVIYSIGGQL